jgi:peroxiredoxin
MSALHNPLELPDDLPAPEDDGGAAHLPGMKLPAISLAATGGGAVDLSALEGRTVVYAYPRTGRPGQDLPGQSLPGGWNAIPGARGCTPQSCSFRDHFRELQAAGADHVFGLSTQDSDYQREAAERLHLPFHLLSDEKLQFTRALKLPTFTVDGMELTKRLTFVADNGRITHVFYPVFPPDKSAAETLAWLRDNPARQATRASSSPMG